MELTLIFFMQNGDFRSSKWTFRASKVYIGQKLQTKVEVDFKKILIPFAIDIAKKNVNGQKQRHVAGKFTSNESSERSPLKR